MNIRFKNKNTLVITTFDMTEHAAMNGFFELWKLGGDVKLHVKYEEMPKTLSTPVVRSNLFRKDK